MTDGTDRMDRSGDDGAEAAGGVEVVEVPTAQGPGRAHVSAPPGLPRGRLVLGHGAGGGLQAPDLRVARSAALAAGWAVVLVEQPWKVAGRRIAGRPATLDAAWLEIVDALPGVLAAALGDRAAEAAGAGPLVVGGRSAGARVACRTAGQVAAAGVVCLAFPLHLPGKPERSRAEELNTPTVPVLVIQGATDPFGGTDEVAAAIAVRPDPGLVTLVGVPGAHALTTRGRRVDPQVGPAVRAWLASLG